MITNSTNLEMTYSEYYKIEIVHDIIDYKYYSTY